MEMQPIADLKKYVDIDDALTRVRGNKKVYKMLLGTFKKSLQYDEMCQQVAEGKFDVAAQTAHSIKGVLANLSLKAAYEKIVQVEAQLKQGGVEQGDLEELGAILNKTLECTEYVVGTL